jgi:hypothetical protein
MNMAFTDRQVEYPNRFYLTDENGNQTGPFTLTRAEGEVIEEGTPLSAENLNTEISEAAASAASAATAKFNSAFHDRFQQQRGIPQPAERNGGRKGKKGKDDIQGGSEVPEGIHKKTERGRMPVVRCSGSMPGKRK